MRATAACAHRRITAKVTPNSKAARDVISFDWLGRMGRLGNQMFQYAALLGIARRRGHAFCIPPSNFRDPEAEHQLFRAFHLPSVRIVGFNTGAARAKPASFGFDPALANECPDGVDLMGFFQSERWFADQAGLIRAEYAFRDEIAAPCRQAIAALGPEVIAVHVRRTDYLQKAHVHPPCEPAYYRQALERMPPHLPVLVISDDIDWCRAQDVFAGDRFSFGEGRDNLEDLCLMTLCRHHVIANSSFSWWGAWLAEREGQVVVAPKRWFGEPGHAGGIDTGDLVPERWERM